MLVYVSHGEHQYTIRDVLETRESNISCRIALLCYRDFLSRASLPRANYIFADLERLDRDQIEGAAKRVADLRSVIPDFRVLNSPAGDLRRLAVNRCLFLAGINKFRVIPVDEIPDNLQFPVFVRRLDDHNGPLTDLLNSRRELDLALFYFKQKCNYFVNLAITEFIDTRNDDGLYEKLSYFRVGGEYFPGAMNFSQNWVCKGVAGDNESASLKNRRLEFLSGNPHEDAMRRVFETARVTYGRADYVMIDGRPQVFEINTNPMIVPPEIMPPRKRVYSKIVLDNWLRALDKYSTQPAPAPEWVDLPNVEGVKLPKSGGHIARRVVRRLLFATDQVHRELAIMRLFRILRIAR